MVNKKGVLLLFHRFLRQTDVHKLNSLLGIQKLSFFNLSILALFLFLIILNINISVSWFYLQDRETFRCLLDEVDSRLAVRCPY